MRILISGGAGFIGHHLIDHLLRSTDWEIICLDRLSETGIKRMKEIGAYNHARVRFHRVDISQNIKLLPPIDHVDYIVHLAGISSIAKSIENPYDALQSNVVGTFYMLELARSFPNLKKFLYFSSDEVINSETPYGATKGSGELMCKAHAKAYGIPMMVTRCSSLIGERQSADKFLPTVVRAAINVSRVRLYVDGSGILPTKDFLHARDAVSAIMALIDCKEKFGANIARSGPGYETQELVHLVSKIMNAPIIIEKVPGPIGPSRLSCEDYGFYPSPISLPDSLGVTVQWMAKRENWHWIGVS